MNVYGIKITDEQISAGLAAMEGRFTAMQIERVLRAAGVAGGAISVRAVDRLFQRERRAGRIKFSAGAWERVA